MLGFSIEQKLCFTFGSCAEDQKSRDACFHVFLMEARVVTFVALCTHNPVDRGPTAFNAEHLREHSVRC